MSRSFSRNQLLLGFTPLPDINIEHPRSTNTVSSLQLHFTLSYEVRHKVTFQPANGKQHSLNETRDVKSRRTIWTDLSSFNNPMTTHNTFMPELEQMGIHSDGDRRLVLLNVTEKVKRMARSVPKRRKVMVIDVVIVSANEHHMSESEVIDRLVKELGIQLQNINSIKMTMRVVKIEEEQEENECKICMKKMQGFVLGMPCQHIFHAYCILNWLQVIRACPLCRLETPHRF